MQSIAEHSLVDRSASSELPVPHLFEVENQSTISMESARTEPVQMDVDVETESSNSTSIVSEEDASEVPQQIVDHRGSGLQHEIARSVPPGNACARRLLPDVDDEDLSQGVKSVIKFKRLACSKMLSFSHGEQLGC